MRTAICASLFRSTFPGLLDVSGWLAICLRKDIAELIYIVQQTIPPQETSGEIGMHRAGSGSIDVRKSIGRDELGEVLSIFHAMVLSSESAMGKSFSQEVSSMVPELKAILRYALPGEMLRSAAKKPSLTDAASVLSDFLMSSDQFGSLDFHDDGKNIFSLEVSDCRFSRSGLHNRLRAGNIICPLALLYAAFLSSAVDEMHLISISPSIFKTHSSCTKMCLAEYEGDGASAAYPEIREDHTLDRIDFEILRIVQANARLSNVEIAALLRTSEATVRRRIQSLMDRGIIKGFVARINHSRLRRKVRVYLAIDADPGKVDDVAKILLARPELCSLYRSIGEYNLICELLMGDMAAVQEFSDEISRTDGVRKANSIIATSPLRACPWYD